MANVAHLVRASGCGSEGSGFDPHHSPQNIKIRLNAWFYYFEAIDLGIDPRSSG